MKDYKEFLTSQKDRMIDSLNRVIDANDGQINFGDNESLGGLREALSLMLSNEPDTRRDQLVSWGFDARKIKYMNLTGSSAMIAGNVANHFKGQMELHRTNGTKAMRDFATNLKQNIENL